MNVTLSRIKFPLLILLQILSFIFIIIPLALSLNLIIILVLFIALELGTFLSIILKKPRRYFYLIWEIQLFLCVLFVILFQFDTTFRLSRHASQITIGVFLAAIFLIEGIFLAYYLLRERIIKKILFVFASSTTIVVIIIIAFIASEGLQAFNQTTPIDFITGTYWHPNHFDAQPTSLNITTEIHPYLFTVNTNETHPYISPNNYSTLTFEVQNQGALEDTYTIIPPAHETLHINTTPSRFHLQPNTKKIIMIKIPPEPIGTYTLPILVKSFNTTQNITTIFTLTSTPYGLDISPDTIMYHVYGNEEVTNQPLILTNLANTTDTYNISLQEPELFTTGIQGNNLTWNYTTSSTTLTLLPHQKLPLILRPQIHFAGKSIVGTYYINITVTSQTHPEIHDTTTMTITYSNIEQVVTVDRPFKYITANQTVNFPLTVPIARNQTLHIVLTGVIPGWNVTLQDANMTFLSGNGQTNYTTANTDITYFNLTVTSPKYALVGDRQQLNLIFTYPGSEPTFGILPFIVGTIATSLLAILIAVPLGIASAIYLSEYAPKRLRQILRPIYELLAGIPSVIYGLWGFFVFGPFLAVTVFPLFGAHSSFGQSILTASIILSIMILPIILTLSEDAIRAVKHDLKEGSYALGSTRWQTVKHILLPGAKSGIVASIILALGRAIGETMAVLMIMGPATRMPGSLFDPAGTMSSVIASTLGWGFSDPLIRHALFAVALILFLLIFFLNIIIFFIQRKDGSKQTKKTISSQLRTKLRSRTYAFKPFRTQHTNKYFMIINPTSSTPVSFLHHPRITSHNVLRREKVIIIFLIAAVILVSGFLFLIIGDIIIHGGASLRPEFLLNTEKYGEQMSSGGFANAIVGSLFLVGIALAFAFPLSVGAAIYIQEYVRSRNNISRVILFASDTLASTPSIVYGAFGFIFFVLYLQFGFSLLAGGITLGFMIMPLILRSTIEAIKSVSNDAREGSFALGATKWQTIRHIVFPSASPMISSGVIISIGRAIGETAAIMFTAGYTAHIATSLLVPAASMPNLIYNDYQLGTKFPDLLQKVYSAAFLLILIVLCLNMIAKFISYRASRMMKH